MANCTISGFRIAGVASAVPTTVRTTHDAEKVFGAEQVATISQSTGVSSRRVANPPVCASDLCLAAAQRLLSEVGWAPSEVGGLVFVSQTPDYVLPATSCCLQSRLGLPTTAFAFDVNLGCSGYVYGLWLAATLVKTMGSRVLLLVGDTITGKVSPEDRSVALLFGDAGTATAIEPAEESSPAVFELGTDGAGASALVVPAGARRHPWSAAAAVPSVRTDGNIRSDANLFMDGPEVFAFTLRRVPPLIRATLRQAGCVMEDVDFFVFHQANRFMLEHLRKGMKMPPEKLVLAMEHFGNTSSASIPLALTTSPLRQRLQVSSLRLVLAGFGVGFSWGATLLQCGPMVMPELVECPESQASDQRTRTAPQE
jgi:3-oxoacyl-[acyl-carrier-protein] synthase III